MKSLTPVRVRVLRPYAEDGRSWQPGEVVTVEPLEALVLARRGYLSLALVSDDAPAPIPPKRRRAYRRRDLTAEPS